MPGDVIERGPTCELVGEDSVVVSCAACGAAWFYPCVCQVIHIAQFDPGPFCAGCAAAYPPEILAAKAFARRARG